MDNRIGVVASLLLFEEQAHVARVIRHNLERCHYAVELASTLDEALQMMTGRVFDALIVSSEQSGDDLRELCVRASRRLSPHARSCRDAPVPMMLACCDETTDLTDRLPGFEALDQPVSLKQIVHRLGETFDAERPDPEV